MFLTTLALLMFIQLTQKFWQKQILAQVSTTLNIQILPSSTKYKKVPCSRDIELPDNSTIKTSHVGMLPLHQSLTARAK